MPIMTPRVVDVYWREPLKTSDFKAMKQAGIWGVLHKSSQGASFKDKLYVERKKIALGEGLLWGAYHFANGDNVKAQVDNFLSVAGGDPSTCLCLDWEDNPGGSKLTEKQARDFLGYVYMMTGQRPVLYGGNTIKEGVPKNDTFFGQHRLWLCQYGPRAVLPPSWDKYWLWQYTGDGVGMLPHTLPGVSTGNMDLNVFAGTIEELRRSWAPAFAASPTQEIAVPAPVVPKTEAQVKSASSRAASWFKGLFS